MWSDISLWFWFAFPCWLIMLSTFSCTWWPSVCFLWKNVYLVPLSVFELYCVVAVWAHFFSLLPEWWWVKKINVLNSHFYSFLWDSASVTIFIGLTYFFPETSLPNLYPFVYYVVFCWFIDIPYVFCILILCILYMLQIISLGLSLLFKLFLWLIFYFLFFGGFQHPPVNGC